MLPVTLQALLIGSVIQHIYLQEEKVKWVDNNKCKFQKKNSATGQLVAFPAALMPAQ